MQSLFEHSRTSLYL